MITKMNSWPFIAVLEGINPSEEGGLEVEATRPLNSKLRIGPGSILVALVRLRINPKGQKRPNKGVEEGFAAQDVLLMNVNSHASRLFNTGTVIYPNAPMVTGTALLTQVTCLRHFSRSLADWVIVAAIASVAAVAT